MTMKLTASMMLSMDGVYKVPAAPAGLDRHLPEGHRNSESSRKLVLMHEAAQHVAPPDTRAFF